MRKPVVPLPHQIDQRSVEPFPRPIQTPLPVMGAHTGAQRSGKIPANCSHWASLRSLGCGFTLRDTCFVPFGFFTGHLAMTIVGRREFSDGFEANEVGRCMMTSPLNRDSNYGTIVWFTASMRVVAPAVTIAEVSNRSIVSLLRTTI